MALPRGPSASTWRSSTSTQRAHKRFEESAATDGTSLGVDFGSRFEVHSIRPIRRAGPNGTVQTDVVIEVTQRVRGAWDRPLEDTSFAHGDADGDFWFRGGATLIVDLDTRALEYCLREDIGDAERYERTKDHLLAGGHDTSLRGTYFGAPGSGDDDEVFALFHRHLEEL